MMYLKSSECNSASEMCADFFSSCSVQASSDIPLNIFKSARSACVLFASN